MDEEVLNTIRTKLSDIKATIESTIDELDVETSESSKIGKTIASDFDDTDLTNVQVAVDDVASQLQNLSAEIAGFLTD